LTRHADKLEHKGFDAACFLLAECFCVKPSHEELVEIPDDCRQQQEHGVLCHEGLWQHPKLESIYAIFILNYGRQNCLILMMQMMVVDKKHELIVGY